MQILVPALLKSSKFDIPFPERERRGRESVARNSDTQSSTVKGKL
jgi:hypothetical protein